VEKYIKTYCLEIGEQGEWNRTWMGIGCKAFRKVNFQAFTFSVTNLHSENAMAIFSFG